MISDKKLNSPYIVTETTTNRYLENQDTGLVITSLSTGYPCYNYTPDIIIGVNHKERFFVFTNGKIKVYKKQILDFEDFNDGFVQLSFKTDCSVLNVIDKVYVKQHCLDVERSNDTKIFVVKTRNTTTIYDRVSRQVLLKTSNI